MQQRQLCQFVIALVCPQIETCQHCYGNQALDAVLFATSACQRSACILPSLATYLEQLCQCYKVPEAPPHRNLGRGPAWQAAAGGDQVLYV
jgi:hypothetical protein